MRERLVVIGADAAGMSAASVARRRRGPDRLEIVAFDRGRFTSCSACGMPYFVYRGRSATTGGAGIDAAGVSGVQTLDDGLALRAVLGAAPPAGRRWSVRDMWVSSWPRRCAPGAPR